MHEIRILFNSVITFYKGDNMKSRVRYSVLLIIVFFLSYGCLTMINQKILANQENLLETRGLSSNGYIVHAPISITGDFGFDFYSFPGNGTKTNPYIIENLNITYLHKGIEIFDTTKHFIIRNCYIETGDSGIELNDNANGTATLINNTFVNNIRAMQLFGISGLTVINNTCYGNSMGIDLWKKKYVIYLTS